MHRALLEGEDGVDRKFAPGIAPQTPDGFRRIGDDSIPFNDLTETLAGPVGSKVCGGCHQDSPARLNATAAMGSGGLEDPHITSGRRFHQPFHLQQEQRLHQLIRWQLRGRT